MDGKSKTRHLADGIQGQHLALSVAAHLARAQFVPDPLRVYDAQHLSEMLDLAANALIRVAPVFVQDGQGGAPRQLLEGELDGARVKRGATILLLKDGRSLSGVSIKRADLRQAIAILKAVGMPELNAPRTEPAQPATHDRNGELRGRLAVVENLLRPPLARSQLEAASRLIVSIARHAPQGRAANLAMQLMSLVQEARGSDEMPPDLPLVLARLRAALHDAESATG